MTSTPVRNTLITPINVPITREIGETMYENGVRVTSAMKTVRTTAPVTSSLDLGHRLDVPAGTTGTLLFRSVGGEPALCVPTTGSGQVVTAIGSAGQQTIACLVDSKKDNTFSISMFSTREKYFELSNPVPYEVISSDEKERELQGAFRVDFIYQGLSRGVLRFSYREFQNGLARPAFTQDLTYDLDADGTAIIGYKGMRMKVLKATNQSITYVIERLMS